MKSRIYTLRMFCSNVLSSPYLRKRIRKEMASYFKCRYSSGLTVVVIFALYDTSANCMVVTRCFLLPLAASRLVNPVLLNL